MVTQLMVAAGRNASELRAGNKGSDPVVGADPGGRRAGTEAQVEGVDREAAALQTHHVGTTRSPVLHVAQVQTVVQHGMAPPAGQHM